MAYIASSDYIEYYHVKGTPSSDDIQRWDNHITRAKAVIDQLTDRTFEAVNDGVIGSSDGPVTRYYNYNEDVRFRTLYLDKDLCEITSIKYGSSDGTTLTTDQYITEPRNETPIYALKIKNSANVEWTYDSDPESGIEVAGIWAYSKTAPADIVWATLRLVDWMEKIRTSNPDLDRPALAGEGTVILPNQIPHDVRMLLEKYKRVRLYA